MRVDRAVNQQKVPEAEELEERMRRTKKLPPKYSYWICLSPKKAYRYLELDYL